MPVEALVLMDQRSKNVIVAGPGHPAGERKSGRGWKYVQLSSSLVNFPTKLRQFMAPEGHLNMFLRIWMFAIHTQKNLTQGQTHSVKSWGMGAIRTTIFVKKPGRLPLVLAQPHLQHPCPHAPHKVPRETLQGGNGKQSKPFLAAVALVCPL